MTSLSLFTFMHWRRKWQPTPVFLPGESQGRWSLVGCRLWGHTESDTTECFLHMLPVYPSSLLPPSSGTHTRSQLHSRGRYDFEIATIVDIQWPPGGSGSETFLAAYEWSVYWSPGYSQLKLYPFNALRYSYLPLSSPSDRKSVV